MKPTQMIVTKRIYHQRKLIADIDTVLEVVQDFERIGGVHVLRKKNGEYICDYGSQLEKTHCKPFTGDSKTSTQFIMV